MDLEFEGYQVIPSSNSNPLTNMGKCLVKKARST